MLEFDEHMLFHNRHERIPFENLVQYESSERKNSKEENMKQVKELLQKGFNQSQIAQELGVNKGTISRYMKEIQ